MEKYGGNGTTAELGQYETPFADVPVMKSETAKESSGSFYSNYIQEIESPFSRSYEAVPSSAGVTPAGEEFVQFLGELHDSEFGNALYELATEIEDTWRNKISSEVAMGNNFLPFVRQHGRQFIMPLAHEVEGMIDKVTQHFTTNNLADHSAAEVESFFSNLEFDHENFSPAQDQFFGKLFDKVKSVVKKGVDLAKKGIAVVGKFLPINIILGKIKGLIKPLLEKVLKFAIGKLPKNLQPYAQDLAKKFLNLETSSNAQQQYDSYQGEDELDAVQTELDTHIAQLLFSPGDAEAENLVNDYETSFQNMERMSDYEDGSSMTQSVSAAREQFINELKSLPQGESPAPAIERFLPALQPLIKIGISIIGREKVVNYIGGLLANLVKSYVPENVAKPLATSIVDIGLKVLGFETYEAQRSDLAYEAIANTIQETIQNMENMSETSLNDKEELTMNLLEAFEQAAANNFPPNYIREDLRKSKQPGVWVMMPRNGAAHYYKKFTHVFDVSIDPQTANNVTTYRGLPLANFLRDKLGLDPSKAISAKVHLYEAIRNTRLSRISKSENLPGLNPSQRYAWIQLLPLTTQASTLLLKEPALGKDVAPKHTNKRYHTTVGQRFYFLEISGAKLRIPPVDHSKHKHRGNIPTTTSRTSQSADIQGVINFVKGEIRLNYYFSEEDAKTIVEKLNKNDFLGAAMGVRHSVKSILNDILIKNIDSKVKIIHEAIPELYLEHVDGSTQELPSLASLGRKAGKEMIRKIIEQLIDKLVKHAYDSMVNYFKSRAAEFKEAQAKPDDGVTIKISWLNIPGMSTIRAAINAIRGKLSISNLTDLTLPNIPTPEIQIAPGKKFD